MLHEMLLTRSEDCIGMLTKPASALRIAMTPQSARHFSTWPSAIKQAADINAQPGGQRISQEHSPPGD